MQSKKLSLIEQVCNVGSGFFISLIYWHLIIVPQLATVDSITFMVSVSVSIQFTLVSIARGYFFRRLFNYYF